MKLLSCATLSALFSLSMAARHGVHLLSCPFPSLGPGGTPSLALVYCTDDGNCNFTPADKDFAWYGLAGTPALFEGSNSRTFTQSGVTFSWTISTGAWKSAATYSPVGSGNNGFDTFTGYKDDEHIMFYLGSGTEKTPCKSTFYFLANTK
ncbi:hypothetical protein GQ53DRAFT_761117 [Thozetella sp. PMI_491]|nr:hypothetical protein GQ53DRAFT_761117 [Thozetella sp. PMI_491]